VTVRRLCIFRAAIYTFPAHTLPTV